MQKLTNTQILPAYGGLNVPSGLQVTRIAATSDGGYILALLKEDDSPFNITYRGAGVGHLVKVDKFGNLLTSFKSPTFRDSYTAYATAQVPFPVNNIQVLAGDKVLVCGCFNRIDNVACNRGIVRLNADGTVDSTFNAGGIGLGWFESGDTTVLESLAIENFYIQSTGKIVVCASSRDYIEDPDTFTYLQLTYNGTNVQQIFRLNADGTLDNTFKQASVVYSTSGVGGGFETFPRHEGRQGGIQLQGHGDSIFIYVDAPDSGPATVCLWQSYAPLFGRGHPNLRLCKLQADGTYEPTFIPFGDFAPKAYNLGTYTLDIASYTGINPRGRTWHWQQNPSYLVIPSSLDNTGTTTTPEIILWGAFKTVPTATAPTEFTVNALARINGVNGDTEELYRGNVDGSTLNTVTDPATVGFMADWVFSYGTARSLLVAGESDGSLAEAKLPLASTEVAAFRVNYGALSNTLGTVISDTLTGTVHCRLLVNNTILIGGKQLTTDGSYTTSTLRYTRTGVNQTLFP